MVEAIFKLSAFATGVAALLILGSIFLGSLGVFMASFGQQEAKNLAIQIFNVLLILGIFLAILAWIGRHLLS